MMRTMIFTVLLLAGAAVAAVVINNNYATPAAAGGASVLDFKMRDIDGKDVKLDKYKGQVLLIVNTASKCGYTPQYEGLEATYEKYRSKGFYVLGFPANNFGG